MAKRRDSDSDEQLREQLVALDEGVLRYLLTEKLQAAAGEEDDKDRLIDRVLKTSRREEISRAIREALYLELGHAEFTLGQQLAERVGVVDKRLLDHDGKIDALGTRLQNSVDQLGRDIKNLEETQRRDVQSLKTQIRKLGRLHKTIGAVVALFAALGAVTGVKGHFDATSAMRKAEETRREFEAKLQALESTRQRYEGQLESTRQRYEDYLRSNQAVWAYERRARIDDLVEEVRDFMTDFSSLLPPNSGTLRLIEKLRAADKMQEAIAQLQSKTENPPTDAASRPSLQNHGARDRDDDDALALELLGRIREALVATSHLTTTPAPRSDEMSNLIETALSAWEKVPLPATLAPPGTHYGELFKRAFEYSASSMSVLRLKKYQVVRAPEQDTLDLALSELAAIRDPHAHVYFPRMYLNWAAVLAAKIEAVEKRLDLAKTPEQRTMLGKEIERLLNEQQLQVQRALQMNEPARFLSNVRNNRAYYSMIEARLWHKQGDQARAKRSLDFAREFVGQAIGAGQFTPAAYFTRAEIECIGIELGLANASQGKAEVIKKKILDDLRVAQQNGHFERFPDLDAFLASFPHMKQLGALAPNTWRADLAEATQIGVKQPEPGDIRGATP